MPKAYLVYNPGAGRFPSGMLAEGAARVLQEYGWDIVMKTAHSGADITAYARQAADRGLHGFFVCGGDGSLNLAARGLLGSDTALGVLPAGTANVWAQELGLPHLTWTRWNALEESAHLLASAAIRDVDVGKCSGTTFLLWAGVGLDAYIVHQIEPRARLEKHFAVFQYAASAAWNAGIWRGIDLKVSVEGKQVSGTYLMALVSNIRLYAGGFAELSPEARLDDGLMDLWLFEGENLIDIVQRIMDVLFGRHTNSEHVFHVPFRSMQLESQSTLYVQTDGEPVQVDGPVEITVQPKALKVFIPSNTPQPVLSKETT